MSTREDYPAGVPCWVETLQPDPRAACDFYAAVFGWDFTDPAPMAGGAAGEYFVARLKGRDVAGVGSMVEGMDPADPVWGTHIRVDDVDAATKAVLDAGATVVTAPFDVPPVGRSAVIADPSGAVLCLWEADLRKGAQLLNEPSAWAMSMLHAPDVDAAVAFYGAAFGWQPEEFGPATLFRLPGYFGGEEMQPVPRDVVAAVVPGEEAFWSVDFWVHDAHAASAKTAELGGTVVEAPHPTPGFIQAVLRDPQGASFSISQLTKSG